MKLTFGPNGDARDLLRLFTAPESWASVRTFVHELKLWHDKGRPGLDPRAFANGRLEPNQYEDLVAVDAFRTLKTWGIPLVLAQGATKSWDKWGDLQRDQMREAIAGVEAAGGRVAGFAIDSPLRHGVQGRFPIPGDGYLVSPEDTAVVVGNFIREAAERGCWCAIHDAWPYHTFVRHLEFIDLLIAQGTPPERFIFDLDLQAFQYPRTWFERLLGRRRDKEFSHHFDALRLFCSRLRMRQIETSCTVMGSGIIRDQADFAAKTRQYSAQMRDAFGTALDRIEVESWVTITGSGEHPDRGEKWCPNVLPLDDPTSHLALVRDIAREWCVSTERDIDA